MGASHRTATYPRVARAIKTSRPIWIGRNSSLCANPSDAVRRNAVGRIIGARRFIYTFDDDKISQRESGTFFAHGYTQLIWMCVRACVPACLRACVPAYACVGETPARVLCTRARACVYLQPLKATAFGWYFFKADSTNGLISPSKPPSNHTSEWPP